MKKHKLLVYEIMSRRMRGKLFWGGLILLTVGVYDLYDPLLGDLWFLVWVAVLILFCLWFYYSIIVRRAALYVKSDFLLLRGPLYRVRISYGRIESITSTQIAQHYEWHELKLRERPLAKPIFKQTCTFVEFNSLPKKLSQRQLWFPSFLFGIRKPGLLLVVADWMKLSRDIEVAKQKWHEARGEQYQQDRRSLAARILDY
jgi:hypothetical protein